MATQRLVIWLTENEIRTKRKTDDDIAIVIGAVKKRQRRIVRKNTRLWCPCCRLRPVAKHDRLLFVRGDHHSEACYRRTCDYADRSVSLSRLVGQHITAPFSILRVAGLSGALQDH